MSDLNGQGRQERGWLRFHGFGVASRQGLILAVKNQMEHRQSEVTKMKPMHWWREKPTPTAPGPVRTQTIASLHRLERPGPHGWSTSMPAAVGGT